MIIYDFFVQVAKFGKILYDNKTKRNFMQKKKEEKAMKNKILLVLQLLLLTVFFAACGTSAEDAADPNSLRQKDHGTFGRPGWWD